MSYNELKQHGTADFPMELYHVSERSPKYNMAHHWHTAIEIITVISGTLEVSVNNESYVLKPGDVIIVNGETVHGAVPCNCVYECIVFSPDGFIPPTGESRDLWDKIINHDIYVKEFYMSESDIAEACEVLFSHMRMSEGEFSRFSCVGALYLLYGEIFSRKLFFEHTDSAESVGDKNMVKLKKVLSFIRSSFDSQITLSDMASVCEMSPKYFCTYFKKMTKKSPVEYLTDYRIERAARLLMKTDIPVTEVCFSCGFNDLSYFIKTFRRTTGQAPGNFRKNNYV